MDEAGRGPLAGPVVVAAVLLGDGLADELSGVRDSKRLSHRQREALYLPIRRSARAIAIAWSHPRQIERLNILRATLSAMRRAVLRTLRFSTRERRPFVLVDGNRCIPDLPAPQMAVIDGDDRSLAVGCASIIAKVFRDRCMARLDRRYPGYGLAQNKGYGTEEHLRALQRLGPSPIHRRTYAPVQELLLPV
ncbi:MAG: ribonuclease HII [Elusimicrobia bacterium]|nr:ribonuclease HII [Elusimicrobiota bacterium]